MGIPRMDSCVADPRFRAFTMPGNEQVNVSLDECVADLILLQQYGESWVLT
jgi:hypothetical protein